MKAASREELAEVCRIASTLCKGYSLSPDRAVTAAVVGVFGTKKRARLEKIRQQILLELMKAYSYETGVTCDHVFAKLASHMARPDSD